MRDSAADAVAAARTYTSYAVGYCLRWVVTVWQAPSIGCPDAITSWEWSTMRRPNDRHPPAGAPVYYRGGQHGHIAISVGDGRIRSTDCQSAGVVSEVPLSWPEQAWGYPYLGWTGDLSKVPLPLTPEEDDEMTKADRDWMAEQFKAVRADVKNSIASHDTQIKTQLGNHDQAVKDRLAAMQSQLDALGG